jgi:lipopolysaccharide transport system ATP-binding protein
MAAAICLENLSKRYRVTGPAGAVPYRTLREEIIRLGSRPVRWFRNGAADARAEEFWALREVSFEVAPGEVVGIIGRNGAGKSTLLKILSRITKPTRGRARLRGRLGSLLEVGTGFHPELTGRENIFLNGAILGMTREETRRKFEEIVAFADVERFLDMPVKRYSSGMFVRLAFAVAAHLEPEILLVDEVLAVGDSAFQKKCLGKMEQVSRQGRTILFVSHQMSAVQHLCQSAILLRNGRVTAKGTTSDVIEQYLRETMELTDIPLADRTDRKGSGALRFLSLSLQDQRGQPIPTFQTGQDATLVLRYENRSRRDLTNLRLDVGIDNQLGQRILWLSTELTGGDFARVSSENCVLRAHLPRCPLMPGRYGLTLFCTLSGEVADWLPNAGYFHVEPGDFYATGKIPNAQGVDYLLDHSFSVEA